MVALAKGRAAFADYQARIIWIGPGSDHLFLAGIASWDDLNRLTPAFVLKLKIENVFEDYHGTAFAVRPPLSFKVFQLLTASGSGRTLSVGDGNFSFSILLRTGSVAELFHCRPAAVPALLRR
jgi:hypothetical protein